MAAIQWCKRCLITTVYDPMAEEDHEDPELCFQCILDLEEGRAYDDVTRASGDR